MNDEQLTALRNLIDYTIENEMTHYNECEPEDREGHILMEAITVLKWLDGENFVDPRDEEIKSDTITTEN